MREVTGMEIIFENCECSDRLTIGDMKESDVYMISIRDIQRSIMTYACNAVCEVLTPKEISITLNISANRPTQMGITTMDETLFQRIQVCPDITHINIYYDNGTEECISVPWTGDSDYENEVQTSHITDKGRMVIKIGG